MDNRDSTVSFLGRLSAAGIRVSLAGEGRLKLETGTDGVPENLLAELRDRKPELLAWLGQAEDKIGGLPLPEPGCGSSAGEVVTPMQRSLWLAQSFEPDATTYNLPVLLHFRGPLDVPRLARAIVAVADRHEVLRSRFLEVDGVLRQASCDRPVSMEIREVVGEGLDDAIRDACAMRLDIEQGHVFGCRLLRIDDTRHVLCLCLHHLVADGWSCGVLLREISVLYSGLERLPPLPFQYRDVSHWLHHRYDPHHRRRLEDFWSEYLAGAPERVEMPVDLPRPGQLSTQGAAYRFDLPPALLEALRDACRRRNCSLHHYLLSTYQLLLHRYSGQADVVVGVPMANRARPEFEALIGLFANTVPLRSRLEPRQRFDEFLAANARAFHRAVAHQALSLEKIVEVVDPPRSLSHTPLFQHLFAFEPHGDSPLALPGIAVEPVENAITTSKYELVLTVAEQADAAHCVLQYATDLHVESGIRRLAENYVALLERTCALPESAVCDYPLAAEGQLAALDAVNDTGVPLPRERGVHRRFRATAHRHASLPALTHEGATCTYAELEDRASRIAGFLVDRGCAAGDLIGICMERSIAMVASMLGVWKAGAAYVPLDPAYPLQRVHDMIEDAGLRAILTTQDVAALLPDDACADRIVLDAPEIAAAIAARVPQPPEADGDGGLAYMIYTSGSTGKPKGVRIGHESVLNLMVALDDAFAGTICTETGRQSTWLAVTSISFDISVLELFWTLCSGFHVVLQPEVPAFDAHAGDVDFSLFYFAAEDAAEDKYRLLLEGTAFADRNGLKGIWVPERHFHSFGDQFPNPAIAAAVVGAISRHVRVRCGSVVLPLHDPLRVAEEWAMVDHFSRGRVEMSVASGWHPNDFVLSPERFQDRHALMRSMLEEVRALWRGDTILRTNGVGKEVAIGTHPAPVQKDLPLWITAAGNPETFAYAGSIGAGVLTHFLGQDRDELAGKIAVYRQALAAAGHPPERARVALMLHTFIADDPDFVEATVREPFKAYLRHSIGLIAPIARERELDLDAHREEVVDIAYQRYFRTSGLFGTVDHCVGIVEDLVRAGVTEIACLIDFGIDHALTLRHLPGLASLQRRMRWRSAQGALLARRETRQWQAEALVVRHGVTHMQATPSFIRGWIDSDDGRRALGQLRLLCIGGEAVDRPVAARLCEAVGGEVFNMYGPTETTVWSSLQKLDGVRVEIGPPMANTTFHVLDAHGHECPVGVPGELYIGGKGMFLGYHRLEAMTRERRGPFLARDRSRVLYRTGDLVQWNERMRLKFHHRVDSQVKLRGYRIELGEIETALLSHVLVSAAAVVVREDAPGRRQLVAYVVPRDGAARDETAIAALRSHVQARLPAHMVPEAFVFLAALPRTPNLKLDRKALPAPQAIDAGSAFAAPRTAMETRLHDLWRQLLGDRTIGIDDAFFRLGGNSLLAIQLASRIKQALSITVSIRDIFEHQTIRLMAAHLQSQASAAPLLPLHPLEPRPDRVPASYAQQLIWFVQRLPGVKKASFNIVNAVEIAGSLDIGALQAAIGHLVAEHDCLRARFVLKDRTELMMEVAREAGFFWSVVDGTASPEAQFREQVEAAIAAEQAHEYDLERGPLLRASLLRAAADRHVLVLGLHHIVADGWGQSLIRQEISENYAALLRSGQPPRRSRSIHYRDFAHHSTAWHEQGLLDGQLEFWRARFGELAGLQRFPTDHDNPLNCVGGSGHCELPLAQSQIDRLSPVCDRHGLSMYAALLAAFKLALYAHSGIARQVVSSYHLGRSRQELENSIGQYAEGLFIVSKIDPAMGLFDYCRQVRDAAFESQSNCDISGVFVRRRIGADLPVLPIVFNYVDILKVDNWAFDGCRATPLSKRLAESTTMVGLEVDIRWTETGLRAVLTYNDRLFAPRSAQAIAVAFGRCVEGLLAEGNVPLRELVPERSRMKEPVAG